MKNIFIFVVVFFLFCYIICYVYAQSHPTGLSGWVMALPLKSGYRKVYIEWNDSGAAGYRIFRCKGAGCSPTTEIAESPTAETNVETDSLDSESWYTFKVQDQVEATPDSDAENYGIYVTEGSLQWEDRREYKD